MKIPNYFIVNKPFHDGNKFYYNIKIKWWGWAVLIWGNFNFSLKIKNIDISFLAKPFAIILFYIKCYKKMLKESAFYE